MLTNDPSPTRVHGSIEAASDLPDANASDDERALFRRPALPRDAAASATLEQMRGHLDAASVLTDLGDFEGVFIAAMGDDAEQALDGQLMRLQVLADNLHRYEEAARCNAALELNEQILGPSHVRLGGLLTAVGAARLAAGDHRGARLHLERALEIDTARFGPERA